ncbi:MAG: hypothetical protein QOF87_1529 [Pseudonocardiales bacterium]|jgi:hypothetical protein|nr:hypothetical protein [Pseudonocardiales bacterium]MDT4981523.1 hypothetical protein [Pseudonocardiales bacterium]
MAEIVLIGHAPSRAMYEQVGKALDGGAAAGLIVHTASEDADGTVRIVDVWESRAAADAWERDVLNPAIEGVMGASLADAAPPDGMRPEYLEPFDVIRG